MGRGWKTDRSRSRMASEMIKLCTKDRLLWAKYASEDTKQKLHGAGVMTTGSKEETIGLTQKKANDEKEKRRETEGQQERN